MNILVIPEDFRNDQYVLKPLFKQPLRSIGKPNARVQICCDPLLGGVGEALKTERIQEIVDQYKGMTDLFILCVDRDGVQGRRQRLKDIEIEFEKSIDEVFLAENAWEEIETWMLAGLDLPTKWDWQNIRAEIHVKERFFRPLARQRDVADGPGGGRKVLGEEAARKLPAIRQRCREDFGTLAQRIEKAVARAQ